jgi:single-strand DNA-binding protein
VGIDGRLEWREWDAQDGTKRQAVEVIADTVQFLGGRGDAGEGGGQGGGNQFVPAGAAAGADADFTATDDDIPF